jgi:hypothetical protein
MRLLTFSTKLKYCKNPSSGSWVVPCGRTDRTTDMTKLILISFLQFCERACTYLHFATCCIYVLYYSNNQRRSGMYLHLYLYLCVYWWRGLFCVRYELNLYGSVWFAWISNLEDYWSDFVTDLFKIYLDIFRYCLLPLEGLKAWLLYSEFSKTEAYYYCVTSVEGVQRLFVIVWTRKRGLIKSVLHVRAVTTWHNTGGMGVQLSHILIQNSVATKCS